METEQKVSVKTMKEIIRSAGLATADLFDRADIEARYAEALTRLDEAERLKSQPKKRRHIAEESSDDDDDGPMIPEPTGVEKSKVANKFSAYAHVDDEEPTGWLKSGSARHKEPAQELRHRAAQMQPYKAALVKTTGAGEMIQIFVRPGHRTLTLDVRPSATVAVVKQMIHIRTLEQSFYRRDAAGVPADTIKLDYGGRVLDDERPLSHYGVADNATLAFGFNWDPKTSSSEEKLLYVKYPADKMAFTSDCIYAVKPTHTVADLKRMILEKEGIIVRGKIYDQIRPTAVPPSRDQIMDRATLEKVFEKNKGNRVPTIYVTDFKRRARASRTVTRLATDLLREVLSYSDLRTLAAGACTCRVLREAVPPKLAHKLVLTKFPILSTVVDESKPLPPARELFESQARLFDAETPDVSPTHSLDEYVFSLELTVGSSNHIGTGTALDDAAEARICFDIPKTLWDAANTTEDRIKVNIMATRRETLRRVALYSGDVDDGDVDALFFEWHRFQTQVDSMAWIQNARVTERSNLIFNPMICVDWRHSAGAGTGELFVRFKWDAEDDEHDMDLEDACLMLEHWCKL